MKGLNALQSAWEGNGVPILAAAGFTGPQIAKLKNIYYAGACATMEIIVEAGNQTQEAFFAILDGLGEEIQTQADAARGGLGAADLFAANLQNFNHEGENDVRSDR